MFSWCSQITVLVLPDTQAHSFPGVHNLDVIGDALVKKGIGVTVARDPEFVKGFDEDSAWQELQAGSSLRNTPLLWKHTDVHPLL